MKLSTTPNLAPYPNSANRQEAAVELKAHRELKGDVLLAADWGRVLEAAHTAAFRDAAWVRARFSDGEVRPIDGHSFGDPAVADSYPMGALGPLMVFCVDDAAFPTGLPAAAVAAAQKKTGEWAWMAFLSTKRVIIFRADATGALESHGPRHFAGSVEGAPQA
jgi:hypothetical protein